MGAWNLRATFAFVSGTSRINKPRRGLFMKSAIVLKVAAVAVVAGLAGCQDLKAPPAGVADLKTQGGELQSDVGGAEAAPDPAHNTPHAAQQAASNPPSTA